MIFLTCVKITDFSDITPSSLVKKYHLLGRTWHLQPLEYEVQEKPSAFTFNVITTSIVKLEAGISSENVAPVYRITRLASRATVIFMFPCFLGSARNIIDPSPPRNKWQSIFWREVGRDLSLLWTPLLFACALRIGFSSIASARVLSHHCEILRVTTLVSLHLHLLCGVGLRWSHLIPST
jgi:hypothetical protein